MTRLEEAVRHDLAVAPMAPPVERIHQRARRRRFRWGAAGLVSVVAVSAAVALAMRSEGPARNNNLAVVGGPTSVSPTTVASSQPRDASLPVATETIFPGLAQVMQRVHGYELADGPLAYGEIVATTRDKTYALFGGRVPIDTRPMDLVRLVGTFTCNGCSTPSNETPAPHGTEILFIFSGAPIDPMNPLGAFSIGDQRTDLSQFGRVYRLPIPATDNAPLTRPIVTMAGCVPSSADEGTGTSTLFAWPSSKRTVQALADPAHGVAGRYAIAERFFANVSGHVAPGTAVDISGRPARVYVGEYGQGAVQWRLSDGSAGYIRARGFDRAALIAIARALRPRAGSSPIPGFDLARPAPFGLAIVGQTAGPVRGSSEASVCTLANGVKVTVVVLRGDAVSRFAIPMDALPLPLLAERDDAVVAVFSPDAAAAARAGRSIHNASIQRWAALLRRKPSVP